MEKLEELAKLVRYYILLSTMEAGSGHPTSSLSAADLMTSLFFGGTFRTQLEDPAYPNNDRLIFSKGHASPLLYALYGAAGVISEDELKTLRKFNSRLEGHPTMAFPYTEAGTGSLGQGLSIGVGMALNAKYIAKLPYRTYVLLGDSEMAEGSVWEAMQLAAHYKLDNLVGILDVNRLGQRGETMYGHDIKEYEQRVSAFGWHTIAADGHSIKQIKAAYDKAVKIKNKPVMIVAKTVKGKGVSFLEDKDGWHGKALNEEEFTKAVIELGEVDRFAKGDIAKPEGAYPHVLEPRGAIEIAYRNKPLATRKAYGNALARIFPEFPNIAVLDAEVSNSTFAETFKEQYPERFFEMYIAEQNMVGVAIGLSRRGKIPFISTFSAFFSRAADQIRMSQYADCNIKFVGSHCGVSIGEDGSSQMGLEDIALFRAVQNSVVLYPSDEVSTEHLVKEAARHNGNVYIRTTRKDTPILYDVAEEFPIGGSKTLKQSENDTITLIGAGVTLFEALQAAEELANPQAGGEGIAARVVDLYSVKPLDGQMLKKAAAETKAIITVEDHCAEGGIGEAVAAALAAERTPVYSLAVRKMPKSGKPEELMEYEEISKEAIVRKAREVL
jgi:transketolase